MQAKNPQLELDIEQWTGSNLRMEFVKAICYHLAYLTSMQSTACEMPGWVNHKHEPRVLGERPTTSHMHVSTPDGRKHRGTKELDECETRE